jgi:hypothetical protein
MNSIKAFRRFPERLRDREFVNPWIFPWFTMATLVIGIPGTLARPLGSWVAIACGLAICLAGATALWFALRAVAHGRLLTWVVVVSQVIIVTAASFVTQMLNPVESFASDADPATPTLDLAVSTFLSVSLTIVWGLTWILIAILVAFHRAYRSSRRLLLTASARLESASARFSLEVLEPIRALEIDVASQLRKSSSRLDKLVGLKATVNLAKVQAEVSHIRDAIVSPALTTLASISLDENSTTTQPRSRRGPLTRVAARWNGRYFSGVVGALIIGIVAIAGSTSVNVSSPGFIVQIPLIMLAFLISVPAALVLFFAAALTPFLGPGSNAPENLVLFVVIVLLAMVSFLQRANEVRQLRNLEGLTVANSALALEFVGFRQQAINLKKRINSVLHGKVQSNLVVAEHHVNSNKPVGDKDLRQVLTVLHEASKELAGSVPNDELDFATAIGQVVSLWDGSINVTVMVSPEAEEILVEDSQAAATAIEVVSEGTLNAAKHASTSTVSANITAEGRRLRIAVTNDRGRPDDANRSDRSSRLGLDYLRQLTSELRLESTETSTTLFAEVPSRLSELASR